MDRVTELRLIDETLEHAARRTQQMEATGGSAPIDIYTSPAQLDRELALLFRGGPLVVGHTSQLAAPGDFLTHDETGVPLVVLRSEAGELRAYLNVCRHRGTRIVAEPAGRRLKALVCPYHGWTYDTDGQLFHIPHEVGFPQVDRRQSGLVPLPVVAHAGLVWVRPTPGDPLDLPRHLGPLEPELAHLDLASHTVHQPRRFRKALNWKLAMEVFLEAYHLKRVHADSIYPLFFDNLGLHERLGRHLRNIFPKRTITQLAHLPESERRLRPHANILYYVFPNTMLLVQPDHVSLFSAYPVGTEETEMHYCTLVPEPPTSEKALRHWQKNIDILFGAVQEDFAMGESIQRGLRSGANTHLTYGRFEHSLTYFHRSLTEALAT
ncbi:MAG TPA: SRPBCC family protein [Polyangia bacterium]|nr:SRPBCC family protein [Polyangia bacterium]